MERWRSYGGRLPTHGEVTKRQSKGELLRGNRTLQLFVTNFLQETLIQQILLFHACDVHLYPSAELNWWLFIRIVDGKGSIVGLEENSQTQGECWGKNRNAFLGLSHRTHREEISVFALLAFSIQREWVASLSSLNMSAPLPSRVSISLAWPLYGFAGAKMPAHSISDRANAPHFPLLLFTDKLVSKCLQCQGGTVTEHRPNWQLAKILVKMTKERAIIWLQFVAERERGLWMQLRYFLAGTQSLLQKRQLDGLPHRAGQAQCSQKLWQKGAWWHGNNSDKSQCAAGNDFVF